MRRHQEIFFCTINICWMLVLVADLDSYVCSVKEGPFSVSYSDNACQLHSQIRENVRPSSLAEERSNRMKREVWDALLSADGTISRSEVQHLNGRAGGLVKNASPVYIRLPKLGHVYEWLNSNSQYCCLWFLHPCSTADSRRRKTVAVCWNCRKKNKSPKVRQQ